MNINEKFNFDMNTPSEEKYRKVIEYLGEENIRPFIPVNDIEQLKKAYKNDKHFNNIPLKKWNIASGHISYTTHNGRQLYNRIGDSYFCKNYPKNLADLLISKGITSFSVAECVCILKECSRMWVEESEKEKFEGKELE